MTNIISNPEDRKKIRGAMQEISDSMTRIDAEKSLIKEIIKDICDNHELSKRQFAKMAKLYHKQTFLQEVQANEELELLYENIVEAK